MATLRLQNYLWTPFLSLSLSLSLGLLLTTTTTAIPTQCANALVNPSFESGALEPWLDMATGSFSTRGLSTTISPPPLPHLTLPGSHTGPTAYVAHSNASARSASTLTLSQSYVDLPVGVTVSCWAWVASSRPTGTGQTRMDVFVDAESCGPPVWMGGGSSSGSSSGWVRVGGQVVVRDVGAGRVGHTVSVSVQGDGATGEGWSVAVDHVGVGVAC